MTYRKKLIEVAVPLVAINAASASEKFNPFIKEHPRKIHLWWARRPLVTCRAVIFASLVDDPNHPDAPPDYVGACRALPVGANASQDDTPRQRLFDFIEQLVQWDSTTDNDVLETARQLIRLSTEGEPPVLLDPFAGGGSIPLEAQRLGLEAHASDLNPVAVMINKALIEIAPRFAGRPPVNPRDRGSLAGNAGWNGAAGLAADVQYYGKWMRERAKKRIGHLYPDCNDETVIAWLWARTVRCPNPACGARMPLIRSFWLSKKKGRKAWLEPRIDRATRTVHYAVKRGQGKPPEPPKVGRGPKFRCLVCGEQAPDQHLKDEGTAGRMDVQLMGIITEGDGRRNYHPPKEEHAAIAAQAVPDWKPRGEMAHDPRAIWCKLYGLADFADLFTPRQLVAMTTFSDLVTEARAQVHADAMAVSRSPDHAGEDLFLRHGGSGPRAYAEAVSLYLAFALSRWSDYANTICTWNTTNANFTNLFSRQAIPMTWDFAEVSAFNPKLSYATTIDWIVGVLKGSKTSVDQKPGYACQKDATRLSAEGPAIVCTDPPYYDNIGYAALSDYYYVWLRNCLRDVYPDEFATLLTPKEPELVADPYRFDSDRDAADNHFEEGLRQAFSSLSIVLSPEYPFTLFYAFKQEEIVATADEVNAEAVSSTGWETMLESLMSTGFNIIGTWPMRTERPTGLKNAVNALASSILLVCRPRSEAAPMTSRREFVNTLRQELPEALRAMQSGNIAPVDLAQASIGPGMAVFSRYSKVLEPNGDRLTVRTALQLINRELDAYLAEQEGYIDEASRFAVAWFQQFGFDEGPFGQADVLARAKNTSVEGLARAGVLESGAGKVRLYGWEELDPGWDPTKDERLTVWEATHHLIERLNTHGEEGAARLLARLPSDVAAQARQLAYRLYSICERKEWPQHARHYNALVVSWSASQEQATGFKEQYQQGELL